MTSAISTLVSGTLPLGEAVLETQIFSRPLGSLMRCESDELALPFRTYSTW